MENNISRNMNETSSNPISPSDEKILQEKLLLGNDNFYKFLMKILIVLVISILVYYVTMVLPVQVLVWQISSGQSNWENSFIRNQRTMTVAAAILMMRHWDLVLEERFQSCEGIIISLKTDNKRTHIWNGLIEIDHLLHDSEMRSSLELYFIVHTRSSDIRKDEYLNICNLFKRKKMSYKWQHPKKFFDE
jgi:hypothetical protein